MRPEQTAWLEERCDEVNADARAAEVVRAARRHAGGARSCTCAGPCAAAPSGARSPAATTSTAESVRYLNRLSDLLFILVARRQRRRRGAAVGAGREPLTGSSLFPAEHRALRELHAMAGARHRTGARLGQRLGGAAGRVAREGAADRRASCWRARRTHRGPRPATASRRPRASAARLASLRNLAGDLMLERNQALRAAVLDVVHVTTLLAYLAALADRRGDAMFAAWHRRKGCAPISGCSASASSRSRRSRARSRSWSASCARAPPGMSLDKMPIYAWAMLVVGAHDHFRLSARDSRHAAARAGARVPLAVLHRRRRAAIRCCGSTCSGCSGIPRSTSFFCPRRAWSP